MDGVNLENFPYKKETSQTLAVLSVIAVVFAAIGFLVGDIWLDSTRWLLVAAVLGIWGTWLSHA